MIPEKMTKDQLVKKCEWEPEWFFENVIACEDKRTKQPVPFRMTDEQRVIFTKFWDLWVKEIPVRLIILKPRQIGVTTLFCAVDYWMSSTQKNTKAFLIGNTKETGEIVFRYIEHFLISDQRAARGVFPLVRRSSRQEVFFLNPNKNARQANPGLNSVIQVATADNRAIGHGWAGRVMHATEVSRWKYPEILTGLLNGLTRAPYTLGVMESTANGPAGVFYDTWMAATRGENEWVPIFLSWAGRPEYRVELNEAQLLRFEPSKSEERLMDEYGLDAGQIEWRRRMLASPECANTDRDPEDVFREQFPLNADEAWVGRGQQFFDMAAVARLERELAADPKEPATGTLLAVEGLQPSEFHEDPQGWVDVWEAPRAGHDYVIGADVGSGLSDGDFSVAYVLHRRSRKVVARVRTRRFYPDAFGERVAQLGWWYNKAFMGIESNSVGLASARAAVDAGYSRMAFKTDITRMGDQLVDPERPGFFMDQKTRRTILIDMRAAMKAGTFKPPCRFFLAEVKHFIVTPSPDGALQEAKPKAARHKKDDTIMAMAIAFACLDPLLSGPIREKDPEPDPLPVRTALLKASQDVAFGRSKKKTREEEDVDGVVYGGDL